MTAFGPKILVLTILQIPQYQIFNQYNASIKSNAFSFVMSLTGIMFRQINGNTCIVLYLENHLSIINMHFT